jgi:hypothetical protein
VTRSAPARPFRLAVAPKVYSNTSQATKGVSTIVTEAPAARPPTSPTRYTTSHDLTPIALECRGRWVGRLAIAPAEG